MKIVIKIEIITAPCDQPVERGPCNGNYPRWAFNKETSQCEQFSYGGCKGNKNNYVTEASCNYHCKKPGVHKGILKILILTDRMSKNLFLIKEFWIVFGIFQLKNTFRNNF